MKSKFILFLALVLSGGFAKGQTNTNRSSLNSEINLIRTMAELGDAKAQVQLAMAYIGGDGVPKDPTQSFYWFKKAAEQGNAMGEGGVGTAYINGDGVAKDEDEAFKWFEKAADQGFFPAQDQMGVLYANGMGCEKDLVEAYKWFSLASRQGYQTATDHLFALMPYLTSDQIGEGKRRAMAFVPIIEKQTNSNPTNSATEPMTMEAVQADVKADYSNFIPMMTNRMGTNYAPAVARGLSMFETNALSVLTNSSMVELGEAIKFLTELKKQGQLPGVSKDSHANVTTGNLPLSRFQEAAYPFSVIFHVLLTGDTLTNHYIVIRPAAGAAWQLERAWRTDAEGRTIKEWPVK